MMPLVHPIIHISIIVQKNDNFACSLYTIDYCLTTFDVAKTLNYRKGRIGIANYMEVK